MSKAKFIIIRFCIIFLKRLALKSKPVLLKINESHRNPVRLIILLKKTL